MRFNGRRQGKDTQNMLKNQLKKFWQSKGFYVALTFVIIGSVIASYLAVNTMLLELRPQQDLTQNPIATEDHIIESEDVTWNEPIAEVEVKEEDVPIETQANSQAEKPQTSSQPQQEVQTQPSAVSSVPSSSTPLQEEPLQLQEPADLQAVQGNLYSLPVQGSILQTYSGDELVYNETMGDWRTHNGIDIAAVVGTEVVAPANMTVKEVIGQGEWGGIIVLENGATSVKICGLSGIKVKAGDTVKQGATLGSVAEFAAEMTLGTHIHLEVQKDGVYVNPSEIFTF